MHPTPHERLVALEIEVALIWQDIVRMLDREPTQPPAPTHRPWKTMLTRVEALDQSLVRLRHECEALNAPPIFPKE